MSVDDVLHLWIEESRAPGAHLRYELDRLLDSEGYMANVLRLEEMIVLKRIALADQWMTRFPRFQKFISMAAVAEKCEENRLFVNDAWHVIELGADDKHVVYAFFVLFHAATEVQSGEEYTDLETVLRFE